MNAHHCLVTRFARPAGLAAVAIIAALSTGCASIVNGQNQPVSIDTRMQDRQVAAANCSLVNDKGTWFVNTPGSVTVQRSYGDLLITCKKDGVPEGALTVKSSTKPMAFGNILFGGVIGAGVDMATGAAYDYPALITIQMGQRGMFSAPPQPTDAAAPAAPAQGGMQPVAAPAAQTAR